MAHGAADQPIRVEARVEGDRFELSVMNGGEPIPEAERARLFQPYYRVKSIKRREGLGLGLFIAAQIAAAHSGTLSVTSDAEYDLHSADACSRLGHSAVFVFRPFAVLYRPRTSAELLSSLHHLRRPDPLQPRETSVGAFVRRRQSLQLGVNVSSHDREHVARTKRCSVRPLTVRIGDGPGLMRNPEGGIFRASAAIALSSFAAASISSGVTAPQMCGPALSQDQDE